MLSLVLSAAAASYDPDLHWQTLPTEHFEINYHDGEEQLAAEMAVAAEEAYAILTPEIKHESRRKIQVTLIDWTDSANGYASVVPYNAIVIYVTAPQEDSTLGLYTDWSSAIITHELTHILHIDTVEGLPALGRAIFGRIISVHQLSPGWIVEGYATFEETRMTTAGRGRSAAVDMVKRTAVLEDKFPPLGNMDGFQPTPPRGQPPLPLRTGLHPVHRRSFGGGEVDGVGPQLRRLRSLLAPGPPHLRRKLPPAPQGVEGRADPTLHRPERGGGGRRSHPLPGGQPRGTGLQLPLLPSGWKSARLRLLGPAARLPDVAGRCRWRQA